MTIRSNHSSASQPGRRRGAALLVMVMSVALIVSLAGLAGLALTRIERRRAESTTDLLVGRRNARSAVEFGLAAINADSNWRTSYSSGTPAAARALGNDGDGSIQWLLEDTDGSLTNTDIALRLSGIGRVGDVTRVSSVAVTATGTPSPEQVWLDEFRPGSETHHDISSQTGIGATFTPTLPTGTVRWSITRVAIWCRKVGSGTFATRVTTCAADGLPETMIDSLTLSTDSLPTSLGWYEITLPEAIGIAPNETIAVLLLHGSGAGTIAQVSYGANSLQSAHTKMCTSTDGGGTWTSFSDRDLWIKVYGTYTTSSAISATTGTWTWDPAP